MAVVAVRDALEHAAIVVGVVMSHRERLDVARSHKGGMQPRVDCGAAHRLVVLPHDGQLVRNDGLVLRQRDVLVRERGRLRAALRLGKCREVSTNGAEPLNLIHVHPVIASNLGVRAVAVGVDRVNVEERGVFILSPLGTID